MTSASCANNLPNVVVIGCTSQIGIAIVQGLLLQKSSYVIGVSRSDQSAIPQSIAASPFFRHAQVSDDFFSSETIMKHLFSSLPCLSGLVCLPSYSQLTPIRKINSSNFEHAFLVNVYTPFLLARAFSQSLGDRHAGSSDNFSIVFMGTVAASRPARGQLLYSISKSSLSALAKSLAVEFADLSIRVNVIEAGFIKSEASKKLERTIGVDAVNEIVNRYPLGPGTPSDIGSAVSFFLSSSSRWITGSSLLLDGGYSLT